MGHGSGYGRIVHEGFIPVRGSLFSDAALDRLVALQQVNPLAEWEVPARAASEKEFDERHREFGERLAIEPSCEDREEWAQLGRPTAGTVQGSNGVEARQQTAVPGTEMFALDGKEYNYTLHQRVVQPVRMRPSSVIKHLIDYARRPIPPVNYDYVPRQPLHLQGNLIRSLRAWASSRWQWILLSTPLRSDITLTLILHPTNATAPATLSPDRY